MSKELSRKQRRALGRGLSALLPSNRPIVLPPAPSKNEPPAEETAAVISPLPEHFETFESIPLEQIEPGEEQPRHLFDGDKLMELSQSIRSNGLLQPITVYKQGEDRYRIITGERRWRAARLAGLTEIPALVRTVDHDKLLELALIENIQREDLNPVEIANGFYRLSTEHGLSHEQIAERTGKDRSTVTNFLRLLRLGAWAREELASGRISVGHARTLLNITDEDRQAHICRDIVARQLSVRETEALVKRLTQDDKSSQAKENKGDVAMIDPNVRAALEEMEAALGTKVKLVTRSGGAGRLEIEYYSQEDLDRIYGVIVKQ